jgi:hypothetical protein
MARPRKDRSTERDDEPDIREIYETATDVYFPNGFDARDHNFMVFIEQQYKDYWNKYYKKRMTPSAKEIKKRTEELNERETILTIKEQEFKDRIRNKEDDIRDISRDLKGKEIAIHHKMELADKRLKQIAESNEKIIPELVFEMDPTVIQEKLSRINMTFLDCMLNHMDDLKALIQKEMLRRI